MKEPVPLLYCDWVAALHVGFHDLSLASVDVDAVKLLFL